MLSTFIKLPYVIRIFVLSIFEWPFYTSFIVHHSETDNVLCPPELYPGHTFVILFNQFSFYDC